MNNEDIAKLLRKIAAAYSIENENKFRFQIIAYFKAADIVDNLSYQIKDVIENPKFKIPGIGASLRSHLEELFKTGKVKHFDEVLSNVPSSVFPLLGVPSLGPKKAYKLVEALGLMHPETVIEDIKNAALKNKIAEIPTFGQKSQEDIVQSIDEFLLGKTKSNRMALPVAKEIGDRIVSYLLSNENVKKALPLGSLRRMKSTIGDVDIAVSSNNPKAVIDHFIKYALIERVIEKGEITASFVTSGGKQVDLMVLEPGQFGSLLQHFTGSKEHNIALREYAIKKGYSLSEKGIKLETGEVKTFDNEKEFYKFLDLDWIPPEIRENQGEVELALEHKLPKLLELSDIKADFHLHSDFPIEPSHDMGKNSMQEMLKKAEALNYEYIAFSEHSPSTSKHTKKQIYELLASRKEYIEQLNKSNRDVRVINMLEVDILPSGELAMDDYALKFIDAAIVSIHSNFSIGKSEMTKRVLKGLSHPKAKILAHPTGRLINSRNGYELEWEKVFEFIRKNNKAIEINAWPSRLDLPDNLVMQAREAGVKFVIDTDSHATYQMDNMFYGVAVARRGWCTKEDVLNTLSYEDFMEWLKKQP